MSVGFRIRELTAKAGIAALKASGFYDGYWNHWRGPIFDHAEAKGLHILPVHYYSPIPQMSSSLRERRGFAVDVEASTARLNELIAKYDRELVTLFTSSDYDPTNAAYGPIDAAALYCLIRESKPKRIVEIGSGHSTIVTSAAIRATRYSPEFLCIEPYLPDYLRRGVEEVTEFIETPLQSVPLSVFTELGPGDILFIDSTHVASFGSDVLYEYLTILPSLSKGVLVHIHDIFLPDDYPAQWLRQQRFFWNEQYVLEAFLAMNSHYKVELAVNAASKNLEPSDVTARAASVFPASFWIRRT